MSEASKHYLEVELQELFQTDPRMWEFIQRGSLDGVWYWDLENPDAEWMSPEMWRLFGYDPATKRHDPAEWQHLIDQDDLKLALENFEKHCADPSHPYDQIVRYRHADGSTVWVRCRGIAIRDASGKPRRMLGAHNDITAVKMAEESAKAALRESRATNEELRNFAYSISHDLKSPSNTTSMLLNEIIAVDDGNLSEDQRDLIGHAMRTIAQMQTLVEDMLSYTRLIGDEQTWEPVSVREVVETVKESLGALICETGADVTVQGELPVLQGHPVQIRVLVQNLIENAIKYRAPDRMPVVTIAPVSAVASETIAFSVSDNGLGISPEHEGRIFDLFKRLHRADEIEGAGIGLTLCRRVMLNHGGDISLTSTPDEGTTFTLLFPRRKQ